MIAVSFTACSSAGPPPALHRIQLADGQCVQVLGLISVYEPRGQYQMIVRLVQARGAGTLQAKFEALKRKLAAEGLFESARKRPLPRFPRRLGLVTSPTGAAIRDFLKVLHRRQPGIEILIYPVRVQGRGASLEIARAIREFGDRSRGRLPAVDVIVITRGGGSIEDLWEFNEEIVARAIAASPVPVLSAIGHEIDFTIADFVADLRAPTPSAAAEILAADRTGGPRSAAARFCCGYGAPARAGWSCSERAWMPAADPHFSANRVGGSWSSCKHWTVAPMQ